MFMKITSNSYVIEDFGTQKYLVLAYNQYYRLITYMFAHADIMHLAVNMLALFSLATPIKIIYSDKYALVIYIISGLISGVAVTFFTDNITIGSSGAVYGLFGLLIYKAFRDYQLGYKDNLNALLPVIIINLVISFMPGISLIGHLAGLLVGIIAGYIYYTKYKIKGFFNE